MFSNCNTTHTKKNTWVLILLTIKRIKHKGHEEYIRVSTYWLEFMFLAPFFFQYFVANHDSLLKFSKTESSVYTLDVLFPFSKILLPFKNWGMRRTTGTTGFLWSRFDVPSLSLPGVAKMTKSLKTLGTRLAPGPQHLKQEKGKSRKRKGESGSSQLVKTEEKENALLFYYSLWAGHIWYSQLETVDCETLHLFTSKIDKACEWTYNCLIGHWVSKYKWFVWDNHRCCCKLCFQLNLAL